MNLDHVNAGFELAGACCRAYDCWRLYKAKRYSGVHPASTIFFFSWGLWNIILFTGIPNFLYSLTCSVFLCSMNAVWLILAYIYRNNTHGIAQTSR
jgi:O-antigen ligase